MSFDFETTTYGKWILAGEHAVLRDCPAIIFPVKSKLLHLTYTKTALPLRVYTTGTLTDNPDALFNRLFNHAFDILEQDRPLLTGEFRLHNTIPIRSGLGASAALCVALGKWFIHQGMIAELDLYEFSRQLEDLFHGESSGADVMVSIANQGLYFSRDGAQETITPAWQPQWLLTHTGTQGSTAECIQTVKAFIAKDPAAAKLVDQQMKDSVLLAKTALTNKTGLPDLAKAINQACECFKTWGLVDNHLSEHMQTLKDAGALACKPTGSGGGGFVLSVWDRLPQELGFQVVHL